MDREGKMKYDHKSIERKWQAYWTEHQSFKAEDFSDKPKFYALIEFPYPSGEGLHAGHPRPYTAMDVVSRKRRMEGYNVLLPMGWDAFGLPTENYAIKNKIHPSVVTEKNIARFPASCRCSAIPSTGRARSLRPTRNTINGPSGSFADVQKGPRL